MRGFGGQDIDVRKRSVFMIKAGIIGSTGYAGAELVRLLAGHPDVRVEWYLSLIHI